jgi:hypothetical protein
VLESLIVTDDNYIVAGHRRLAALIEIGQVYAPCRVLPVRHDSMTQNEFVKLLREHNRQRNKNVAEQVREELVDIDPAEAAQNLWRRRSQAIRRSRGSGVAELEIEGQKRRCAISEQKSEHVKHIKLAIEELREYWPQSVRKVHYQLLNYSFCRNTKRRLPYANDDASYNATSELMTRLLLVGEIPWDAVIDTTRPLECFQPFDNVRDFIRSESDNFLCGYWRNLQQSQPAFVILIVEKNTVLSMVSGVARKYQIPVLSGRGFASISAWHDVFEMYRRSGKDRLVMVMVTDHDPEGLMIGHVAGRTFRDDFGLDADDLTIVRAAVTREQIVKYRLPEQNFAKETSSNHQWYLTQNDGDSSVYELEAMSPTDMLRDLEEVICSVVDIDLYNREVAEEEREAVYLEAARGKVIHSLKGLEVCAEHPD